MLHAGVYHLLMLKIREFATLAQVSVRLLHIMTRSGRCRPCERTGEADTVVTLWTSFRG